MAGRFFKWDPDRDENLRFDANEEKRGWTAEGGAAPKGEPKAKHATLRARLARSARAQSAYNPVRGTSLRQGYGWQAIIFAKATAWRAIFFDSLLQ